MNEKSPPNPLREGLSNQAVPQPCTVVIFGATGDLTLRKLIPALYNIAADGELPPAVAVVGFARRPKTDDQFRKEMERGHAEIFAPNRARRDLGRIRAIRCSIIRASSTMQRVTRAWRSVSTNSIEESGTRRESAVLSRGRARPIRDDPRESAKKPG